MKIADKINVSYVPFKHPATYVISGGTGSGKTFFLSNLLINAEVTIDKPIQRLVYCYGVYLKDTFALLKQHYPQIELISGIDGSLQFDSEVNNFLIFDDLMCDAVNSTVIRDYFTKGSHHKNISVILLTQNLYQQGSYSRTINYNTQYVVYFKNPRNESQVG